ncbi:LpxI family protein [Falsirhodobacter algicola]|uniref:UDP-2,3-diacylglucosamine diphosphatase LpxI n=1 Tax=Falsirhodobacter algicola TaxID=2692330 RepID=A0A8J8SKJ6_9RHOB|nr:UDP-2,3-diacylglucosamine diphosphatase LpxI [Falsirhodobacter algicola]QUS35443.1 UDP-2,3-diacylglucosamine diphosphatase LpxI [Falsirhodobacter algicola]
MTRTAIIAGQGDLPAALAARLDAPVVAALEGFIPEGLVPDATFRLERLAILMRNLIAEDVTRVIFAGAVRRPDLDPSFFDPETAQLVPRILAAMQGGDDGLLRAVIAVFEERGFEVLGIGDVAPDLVPAEGVLTGAPTAADEADAARAAAIVRALGDVDVGQGAVVAGGLCLAIEALPGTDAMLDWVAMTREGEGGVFFKAPKPGQDRRIDLPTLGPATIRRAAKAALSCIAWEAGGVILLNREAVLAEAEAQGITLWARAS